MSVFYKTNQTPSVIMTNLPKKKCRQYLDAYLSKGFIANPINPTQPLCLICRNNLSNEAMKPSRLNEHLTMKHLNDANKDIEFFKDLKSKFDNLIIQIIFKGALTKKG